MRWFALEDTLNTGVALFHTFVRLDELFRTHLFAYEDRTAAQTKDLLQRVQALFTWWLTPCEHVERELEQFEKQGFDVKHSAGFRKCYADAKWMVAEAKDALSHQKMVEARDAAIDLLRSG